jgi:micrococcal nuclease
VRPHAGWTRVTLVALALAVCGCSSGTRTAEPETADPTVTTRQPTTELALTGGPTPPDGLDYSWRVSHVVDGDTVDVTRNGTTLRVRLIGIDTPETVAPGRPVGCYGPEATEFADTLLAGRTVALEQDPTQDQIDTYGRTLAYVWIQGGPQYNWAAVAAGAAKEYLYDRPYQYRDSFVAAERAARAAGRGLWDPNGCNGNTTRAGTTTSTGPSPGAVPPLNPKACPADAPIKGNQGSNGWIYHQPGEQGYAVTKPEECFATPEAAAAAGYRAVRS